MNGNSKITLAQALERENHDYIGQCRSCRRFRLIQREEIVALNLPMTLRLDQLEERYKCDQCGAHGIELQVSVRNAPYRCKGE